MGLDLTRVETHLLLVGYQGRRIIEVVENSRSRILALSGTSSMGCDLSALDGPEALTAILGLASIEHTFVSISASPPRGLEESSWTETAYAHAPATT